METDRILPAHFVPCPIDEALTRRADGTFIITAPCAWQVFRPDGLSGIAGGSPTIVRGNYCPDRRAFRGEPAFAWKSGDVFLCVSFPSGIEVVGYARDDKPSFLAIRKDRLIGDRIERDTPRPFTLKGEDGTLYRFG